MGKRKTYLVDLVIPYSGDSISVEGYKASLSILGFSRYQILGSLGGVSQRSCRLYNGSITRM